MICFTESCTGDAEDRESTWPRSIPPRKKKEKDVFRFLKEHDVNYTVRRQEFQMSRVIEKCRTVKEVGIRQWIYNQGFLVWGGGKGGNSPP